MKLNLAFAFSVAAACLTTNVISASKNSDTVDIEAPAASHLRTRPSTGSKVDTSLGGASFTAASQVHKADKKMMKSDHHNMISKTSHPARRDNAANSWTQMGPDFIGDAENNGLGWGNALAKGGERYAIGLHGGDKVLVVDKNPLSSSYDQQVGSDIGILNKKIGYALAMSEDGKRLVARGSNFVAMFKYSENQKDWISLGTIDLPNGGILGSVDMTKDGKRIAISNPTANNMVGEVQIHDFVCDGSCSWNEVVVLHGAFPNEAFGSSLSMSNDGAVIVIGSSHHSSSIEEDLVRVFEETTIGWPQVGEDIDVENLALFKGSVSMDGNGKKFAVLSKEGVQVYGITNSGKLELDGAMLSCPVYSYSYNGFATTKLSEDGDRVAATCNDRVMIADRNASTSIWEPVGSIPITWIPKELSLSRNGLVIGLGDRFWPDYKGVATVWSSPNRNKNPRCPNSLLQFQVETVGGSFIPFSCKWARENFDKFTCSNTGQIATHCPKVCGMCSEYGCSDSEGVFFTQNGKERSCAWLRERSYDNRIKQCDKRSVATTCRATCKFCE